MKTTFILLLLSVSLFVGAQNSQEWTQQRKTQKKYLLQQIAALQVYLGYVKKGYTVAGKGLTTIRNIKNGDFNLHRDFIGSLKQVNPKIKKYTKVVNIIAYQARIIKETKKTLQGIREAGQFTTDELDYCKVVFDNLLEECLKNMDELFLLISSGKLEMKDDERIKRIDALYADMQNKYAFSSSFSDEMGLLSVQRIGEQIEINRSKILNGLR
ncbi:MAG: hypothetical protein ABI675_18005 [Chitinophagaceae bacterium]